MNKIKSGLLVICLLSSLFSLTASADESPFGPYDLACQDSYSSQSVEIYWSRTQGYSDYVAIAGVGAGYVAHDHTNAEDIVLQTANVPSEESLLVFSADLSAIGPNLFAGDATVSLAKSPNDVTNLHLTCHGIAPVPQTPHQGPHCPRC